MVDKKLLFSLIVLFSLFVIASLFVYMKPGITGFTVIENCDGNWTNESGECVNGTQEIIWTSNDTTNCNSPLVENNSCEIICEENWSCTEWSECINETQSRTCKDLNECGTTEDKPEEKQECKDINVTFCGDETVQNPNDDGVKEVCDDGENNGDYGYCQSDCLAMGPYCGDNITNGEEECDYGEDNGIGADWSQDGTDYCNENCEIVLGPYCGDSSCDSEEDCDSCGDDCGCSDDESCTDGNCVKKEVENKTTPEPTSLRETPEKTPEPTCSPDWSCTEWSECINETQSRTCEDINSCGSEEGKPAILQSCVLPETCFDGIKNQNETGVDCGGVCEKRCSFFTIVGSVINIPVQTGKQFFAENKTRSFIIVGILVLITGGFVTVRVLKRKNLLSKILPKKLIPEKN